MGTYGDEKMGGRTRATTKDQLVPQPQHDRRETGIGVFCVVVNATVVLKSESIHAGDHTIRLLDL